MPMLTNRTGNNRVAAMVNAESWLAVVGCVVQVAAAHPAAVLRVAVAVVALADRAVAVSVEAVVLRVVTT